MNIEDNLVSRESTKRAEPESNPLMARIARHPFLEGMRPPLLGILGDNAMATQWQAGELIFREGEPANRFYLIEEGSVALESNVQEREVTLIQTLGSGDVLGWSWLFPPYYWHFDAPALKPTKAIFFYGTRLREQCEEDHDLGYELMKRTANIVIQRLQATRRQLLEAQKA